MNARGSSLQFLPLDRVYQAFIETSASYYRKHGYLCPHLESIKTDTFNYSTDSIV